MKSISKIFGNIPALECVDLSVKPGEIHAVVGENGAGKTTLMKVLYGAHPATSGDVLIDGKSVNFKSSKKAIEAGVGMVSQHYAIIPDLTCLQNLILGAEPSTFIKSEHLIARAQSLANQMGFQFEWNEEANKLSPGQAQKLEILKLLWRNAQILILDEPTAMLAPEDADLLYAKLHELAALGATIIVVTHRLPDVIEHCNSVTILRGGKLIWSGPVAETNDVEIAERMIGQSMAQYSAKPVDPGEYILEVKNLTALGNQGQIAVKDATFKLCANEVVGIAGVDGNGQRELFHAVMGLLKYQGSVFLSSNNINNQSTQARLTAGIRLIAEDRHDEAIIESWTIRDNSILGLQRTPGLLNRGQIDQIRQENIAQSVTTTFPTKFSSIQQPLKDLSGGNQQKIVVARALQELPKVILAFQPTRGIDLYVADLVYQGLINASREGTAVLVVSFDLDEVMKYCDRIIVMNHGEMHEVPAEHKSDRQYIGRMMVGATT